jgi:hypothetical protein
MSLSRKVARSLCTTPEFTVFEESTPALIKFFTAKELEKKVLAAKKLKAKYVDLQKKQARESKKKGASSDLAIRTAQKVRLFDDCLRRYEAAFKRKKRLEAKPAGKRGRPLMSFGERTIQEIQKTGKISLLPEKFKKSPARKGK